MTIPRTPNIKSKHTNDPKFAGKGMTSLFIEKIPAVSAMGEMNSCDVGRVVSNPFLSTLFGNYELTIIIADNPLLSCANSR
jgi:hypothetical protein